MKQNQHCGFTLTEMLVVIVIISLLSAILFPVFASARERARQASCASNIHQLGISVSMYTSDYDEKFPRCLALGAQPSGSLCVDSFFSLIIAYHRDNKIMLCPSDPTPLNATNLSIREGFPPPCSTDPPTLLGSYLTNFAVTDEGYPNPLFPDNSPTRAVKSLAQIEYPSDTGLIADAHIVSNGGSAGYSVADTPIAPRHDGLANVAFVDGHVAAFHTRPTVDSGGQQLGGTAVDGQAVLDYTIISDGPYFSADSIYGIPHKDSNGDWTRSDP